MSDVKITKIIDGVEYQLSSYNTWCTYNKQGEVHSFNDKPAVIESNGAKWWCKNGLCHRDNDKPAAIYSRGSKAWWVNGEIQPAKYYACIHIKDGKQYKEFFATELKAKQYESDMLAKGYCAWVIENE